MLIKLIDLLTDVSCKLSTGHIPITINNKSIVIKDVSLEGSSGNYCCNIDVASSSSDSNDSEDSKQ